MDYTYPQRVWIFEGERFAGNAKPYRTERAA